MTNSEALQILCEEKEAYGQIYGVKICISPIDIKENLRANDYELDLEYSQDLSSINEETGDFEMCQGHCLEEVENITF